MKFWFPTVFIIFGQNTLTNLLENLKGNDHLNRNFIRDFLLHKLHKG